MGHVRLGNGSIEHQVKGSIGLGRHKVLHYFLLILSIPACVLCEYENAELRTEDLVRMRRIYSRKFRACRVDVLVSHV